MRITSYTEINDLARIELARIEDEVTMDIKDRGLESVRINGSTLG